jgi:arginine decarboxylase
VIRHLREVLEALDTRPRVELYHEAQHSWRGPDAVRARRARLEQRALLDDLYYAIAHGVRARLKHGERSHRQALDELNEKLVDKYFVNFSVFESIPDVWAIDQVFPILPIERPDARAGPARRDGRPHLRFGRPHRRLRRFREAGREPAAARAARGVRYRLGVFLVGAYQETLGDIHNLFGDTDSVDVRVQARGFVMEHARHGDTAERVLGMVGYDGAALRAAFARRIEQAGLAPAEAERVRQVLEAGLAAKTYLEDMG